MNSSPRSYSIEEALRAQKALRDMAGLPVETFPIQALVGMISDEVEILRTLGHSDEAIATTLQAKAAIPITAAEITDNYASPELRHADRGGQPD